MNDLNLKMIENTDYELIPSPNDSTVWQVRLLTGDYVETIIEFDTIRLNEIKEHISFNFNIIESPDAASPSLSHPSGRGKVAHGVSNGAQEPECLHQSFDYVAAAAFLRARKSHQPPQPPRTLYGNNTLYGYDTLWRRVGRKLIRQ